MGVTDPEGPERDDRDLERDGVTEEGSEPRL